MPPYWQQAARQMGMYQGSPAFALLQGPRAATMGRRRPLAADPFFTPEEEASALRKAGSMAVGGISAAGAMLDVPGGGIRNILTGQLPSINPVSWEGRATGRDVLEHYGILGPNRPGFIAPGGQWYDPRDWDWGDIAGFGTEVALDPWTYLSLGGAAVGRAGKAMQRAGLWDFLPGAATKVAERTGKPGITGRMARRQQMTPRMVLKEMPKELQWAAAKKLGTQARDQGVRLSTLADEPIGGAARFWPTGAVIGKGAGPAAREGPLSAFHGSPVTGLKEIRPSLGGDVGPGVYFGTKKAASKEGYTGGRKALNDWMFGQGPKPPMGSVYELDFIPTNPFRIKNQRHYEKLLAKFGDDEKLLAKWAKGQGYDSIYNHFTGEHIAFTTKPIPVKQPLSGGWGGKVAAALDPIGEAVRYGKYSPARLGYAALSKPLRGKTEAGMQKALADAQVDTNFRIQRIRETGIEELSGLKDAKLLTPEQIRLHRRAVEWKAPDVKPGAASQMTREAWLKQTGDLGFSKMDASLKHASAVKNAVDEGAFVPAEVLADYPDLTRNIETLSPDPIYQLPKGIARDSALRVRAAKDRLLKDEQFAGLGTKELDDVYAAYARRGRVFFDQPSEIAAAMRGLKPEHPSQIRREEFLRNWPDGSETINLASTDPMLSGIAIRERIARTLSPATRRIFERQWKKGYKVSREEAQEDIRKLFPATTRKGVDLDAGIEHLLAHYGDKLPAHMQTPEELRTFVTWLSELDPQHVTTGIPVFGHHPAFDALNREVFSAQAVSAAHAIYGLAGRSARHADDMAISGPRTSLFELLQDAKMTGSGAYDRMIENLPASLRDRFAIKGEGVLQGPFSKETALKNTYIPKQTADDLIGLGRTLHDPATLETVETALGQFWDSWINLFKGHVTAYWPAFIGRNFISGQFQNQIGRAYSWNPFARDGMWSSLNDTKEILRGHDIPNVLEIPMVSRRGITDPHEGTRFVLSSLAAGHLGGMRQLETAGAGIEAVARGTDDLLAGMVHGPKSQLLGQEFRFRDLFTLWRSRGVGTGFMGTGPKREVAEHLLGRFGEDAGLVVETLNRFAPALAMLRQGIDPAEAIRRVKLLQVDYMAQAVGDKYLRRAVPFFAFLKGITKFMAEELSQHPGGGLAKMIRAEAVMQREGLPPAIPEHVRKTAAIPLGTTPEGGAEILTALGFMHEDPLQFLGGVVDRGPLKALTSMAGTLGGEVTGRLAPQISVPIELATGVSLWQRGPRGGRALVDQYGHLGGLAGKALGRPVKLHPAAEEIPQLLGAGRWLSTAGKLADERKTWPQTAWNLLTGSHLTTVSPEQQQKVIGESIEQTMVDLGARQYERPYFPKWELEKMPPAERQERLEVQALWQALNKKRQEQRKQRQAQQVGIGL